MKITIINTTEQKGGASIACKRLMVALNKNGINIKMLVCDKSTNDKNVILIKFLVHREAGLGSGISCPSFLLKIT